MVRQAAKLAGIQGIALTKLDVLDGLEEIKVCVAYEVDGARLDYLPAQPTLQARAKLVYESIPGWAESIMGARSLAALPAPPVQDIRRAEDVLGVSVAMLSTPPAADATTLLRAPIVHCPFPAAHFP